MTTTPERYEQSGLSRPRVVRPARGTCRVMVEINGVKYVARPIVGAGVEARRLIRLRKSDGEVYYVSEHEYGALCDCPDFIFHRDGIDPTGCKHIKALAACGLLSNPSLEEEEEADDLPTRRPWTRTTREALELERDEIPFGPRFRPAGASV